MAYVQPNSIIQLFQGINLDNRYLHTIYFNGASAQDNWFSSKASWTFQAQSYTRYNRNQVKLECDVTEILGATYMRFKNDRSVDMWFYAFINSVEYVNENTALITYEIDVMQTWFIQRGSIRPCMVLREHVSDDTFGINLEAEPVGSDVYDCDPIQYSREDGSPYSLFNEYNVVINTTEEPESGYILNNMIYNGSKIYVLSADSGDEPALYNQTMALQQILQGSWESGERPVEIVDMFTFPKVFCHLNANENTKLIDITHPHSLDGYVPKNKKLFGYPFSYLQATTKNGSGAIYRWEYFDTMLEATDTAVFKCYGNPIGGGSVMCYPYQYNGITENIDCKLSITDFPKNPFNYDSYQAWVASGGATKLAYDERITNMRGATALVSAGSKAFSQTVGGVAQAGISAYDMTQEGAYASGIANMVKGVDNIVQAGARLVNTAINVAEAKNKIAFDWKDAQYVPNQIVGSATPNLVVATRSLDFYFFSVHIRQDELKRIDDFLSVFGYAINKVKQPNLNSRQYWNFIQTQNAIIGGNMPASSKEAIGRIFDGGITFWHNGDQIGNYNQSVSSGSINNPIV